MLFLSTLAFLLFLLYLFQQYSKYAEYKENLFKQRDEAIESVHWVLKAVNVPEGASLRVLRTLEEINEVMTELILDLDNNYCDESYSHLRDLYSDLEKLTQSIYEFEDPRDEEIKQRLNQISEDVGAVQLYLQDVSESLRELDE